MRIRLQALHTRPVSAMSGLQTQLPANKQPPKPGQQRYPFSGLSKAREQQ